MSEELLRRARRVQVEAAAEIEEIVTHLQTVPALSPGRLRSLNEELLAASGRLADACRASLDLLDG